MFKINGILVSWQSLLQSTITLSTTEFKYMVKVERVKESLCLKSLLDDLGIQQVCVKVRCDSQSTIHIANSHIHHAHTKYIDVRYHFIQFIVNEVHNSLTMVYTDENQLSY